MTPEELKMSILTFAVAAATDDELVELIQRLAEENGSLKAALTEIEERFKGKQNLHKDDCFAYQVARKALGTPPTEEK
jgi:hypothetical protein